MNTQVLSKSRFDVYRAVTDTIVAAIEAGAGQFVMPWHGNGVAIAKPQNAHTQMDYHGINVIALWAQAYVSRYRSGHWATYRQWQTVGAQVKSGERGSTIVFFKRFDEEEESERGEKAPLRFVARVSHVFNADRVSGWEPAQERQPAGNAEIMETVGTFVAGTKARIDYNGQSACYRILDDTIEMPERSRFLGSPTSSATEAYSSTLLHELVHWSGAKHRLDRGLSNGLTLAERAAEELVAEIGAAFLCADLGVSNQPRPDHAAYVASWLKQLRNDTRAIFTASRLANQATTYLHELVSANEW